MNPKIQNYINGELIPPGLDQYLDNIDPSTGKVYSLIPKSNHDDVERAVISAQNAFPSWSTMGSKKRYTILNKIARLIDANLDQLAVAESRDSGKPVSLSTRV